MITLVTMTGADESVTPGQLFDLSRKYPFVEWAILVSRGSTGKRSRFPAISWIKKFIDVAAVTKHSHQPIKLSLHLCGDYVNELLMGGIRFVAEDLSEIWHAFDRVQINTHGVKHEFDSEKLPQALNCFADKEFIFQYDEVNEAALAACLNAKANCSTLFDLSHGAGIAPEHWPALIPGVKCGYAGGISPENIIPNVIKISNIVDHRQTWIDMETHVRSNNDKQFDLLKVERCLRSFTETVSSIHDY